MPKTESEFTKVLVVDNQAVVRAGCRALLGEADGIRIVGEAESGEDALQQYAPGKVDVVLLELALRGMGGIETVRRLRSRDPGARVLVFTVHGETVYVDRALQAGARGFLTKQTGVEELREAVRRVGGGEVYLEKDLAQRLAYQRTRGSRSPFVGLSTREFEIFCLLAEGLNGADIAHRLSLSYKTVANYSTEIKTKLGVATSAELARLAIRHGVVKA